MAKEEESDFDELNSGDGCSQDDRAAATKANSRRTGDDAAVVLRDSSTIIRIPVANGKSGVRTHGEAGLGRAPATHKRPRQSMQRHMRLERFGLVTGSTMLVRPGIFESLKQAAAGPRVWVSEGTPQHAAWTEHYRSRGRRLPTTQHRVDGRTADRLDVRKRMAAEFQLRPARWRGSMNAPFTTPIRTAPHNIEAEQALLGAILVNNEAFYRVSDFLEPKHFFEGIHQRIYRDRGRFDPRRKARDAGHAQDLPAGGPRYCRAHRQSVPGSARRRSDDHHQCRGLRPHDLRPLDPPRPDHHRRGYGQSRLRGAGRLDPVSSHRSRRATALQACRERALRQGLPAIWSSIGRSHRNGRDVHICAMVSCPDWRPACPTSTRSWAACSRPI